jgi:5-bromo-4-chloroindolyl phosphate hydrolysis protein
MKNSIFRSILIGLLLGVLVFMATKLILVLLIVAAIFKLSGKGKWKKEQWKTHKMAYEDNIRTMGDEDYEKFKENFGQRHCYNH